MRFYAAAIAILFLTSANAQTPATDTAPATVVPVSVNGDPAARFSLVVMSDGYTAADMPKYRAHLDKHLNVLWSIEPFRSYRNYINVYSVEIVSPESGITCDPATASRGRRRSARTSRAAAPTRTPAAFSSTRTSARGYREAGDAGFRPDPGHRQHRHLRRHRRRRGDDLRRQLARGPDHAARARAFARPAAGRIHLPRARRRRRPLHRRRAELGASHADDRRADADGAEEVVPLAGRGERVGRQDRPLRRRAATGRPACGGRASTR